MKLSDRDDTSVDDALIDRIVDGALTPEELRAAVLRIEADPDGWKRCALAFVEARVWSDSLRALGEAQKSEPVGMPIPRSVTAAKRPRNSWLRSIAAAVIVGLSFVAGWMTHRTRLESRSQPLLVRGSEGTPEPRPSEPSDVGDVTPLRPRAARIRKGSCASNRVYWRRK